MERKLLHYLFLDALYKKVPKKSELADDIADMLNLDKISVYRRLRGSVRFSVDEMGVIARKYEISLDELLDNISKKNIQSIKFDFPIIPDINNSNDERLEENYELYTQYLSGENSEIGGAMGILNRIFYIQHEQLTRFFLFKWGRYYTNEKQYKRFETVQIDERQQQIIEMELSLLNKYKKTFYIWDSQIIPNLVRDIKYYESIDSINKEEKQLIKEDLFQLLDRLEAMAIAGKHSETGNKFELYSASMNINTSHVYLHADDFWAYYLNIHLIRAIITYDHTFCMEMKRWINSLKASSVLISESGEKERLLFFNKQREAVDSL